MTEETNTGQAGGNDLLEDESEKKYQSYTMPTLTILENLRTESARGDGDDGNLTIGYQLS